MQRQGRQRETRALAAAEKPVKVAVQPDDHHRSEHGNHRGPGIPGQRYQREQDQSRERHADLLGGLDVQVGLDGSASLDQEHPRDTPTEDVGPDHFRQRPALQVSS